MRDRTAARNYSAAGEEFRREHQRHRAWGLTRRHAERLRRAADRDSRPPAAGGNSPEAGYPAANRAVRPTTGPDVTAGQHHSGGAAPANASSKLAAEASTGPAGVAQSRPAGYAPTSLAEATAGQPAAEASTGPGGVALPHPPKSKTKLARDYRNWPRWRRSTDQRRLLARGEKCAVEAQQKRFRRSQQDIYYRARPGAHLRGPPDEDGQGRPCYDRPHRRQAPVRGDTSGTPSPPRARDPCWPPDERSRLDHPAQSDGPSGLRRLACAFRRRRPWRCGGRRWRPRWSGPGPPRPARRSACPRRRLRVRA
ncbi:hypothetical protein DFJ67_2812 [Asanoa ferruginea]|uniref:Uncharacterized protein n=1 Tax=Asanoa ferruginea TaxID=53367 RepID=A0A3D9ZIZ1_9ACTN|nr:hypothetical protein DFJ67_2812 [Asanoa ferruginea]